LLRDLDGFTNSVRSFDRKLALVALVVSKSVAPVADGLCQLSEQRFRCGRVPELIFKNQKNQVVEAVGNLTLGEFLYPVRVLITRRVSDHGGKSMKPVNRADYAEYRPRVSGAGPMALDL
jgi:hypothetical protein